jgi:hypothetical protein
MTDFFHNYKVFSVTDRLLGHLLNLFHLSTTMPFWVVLNLPDICHIGLKMRHFKEKKMNLKSFLEGSNSDLKKEIILQKMT